MSSLSLIVAKGPARISEEFLEISRVVWQDRYFSAKLQACDIVNKIYINLYSTKSCIFDLFAAALIHIQLGGVWSVLSITDFRFFSYSCTCVSYSSFLFIVQGGLTVRVACCLHAVYILRPLRALRASSAGAKKAPQWGQNTCNTRVCMCGESVGGVYMLDECTGGCWLTEGTRQGRQMVTFWSKLPWTQWLSPFTPPKTLGTHAYLKDKE